MKQKLTAIYRYNVAIHFVVYKEKSTEQGAHVNLASFVVTHKVPWVKSLYFFLSHLKRKMITYFPVSS